MRRDARGRGWLYEGRMHGRHRFAAILARLPLRRAPHRLTALESVLRRHHSRAVERVGHKNHCEGHYHDLSYGQHRQTRYMGERLKSSLWVRGINGGEQRKRNACAGQAPQAGALRAVLNSQALRPGLNCFAPPALGREEFQIDNFTI